MKNRFDIFYKLGGGGGGETNVNEWRTYKLYGKPIAEFLINLIRNPGERREIEN